MNLTESRKKFEESKQYLAGGVASTLRASLKPLPLFVESASGARVKDVDGNEYIDYKLAYGPLILGHAHPVLTARIAEQMARGTTYGMQHDGEIKLAKKLVELIPCAELVCLSGSGTEAVMLAIRLARAYTGKSKVVRFHGHFHGWSDTIYTSFPGPDLVQGAAEEDAPHPVPPGTGGQSRKALEEIILVPWNDPVQLESVLRAHKDEIAAVISEPVMCNSGCMVPKSGYLEKMRELTRELGIVMILDEVITGFRLGPGGAQERFGIVPDLTTVGKALGGGIAISAVAGKKEIMQLVEKGTVGHLGTLNGNCVATTAALTVIEELTQNDGEAFKRMERLMLKLAEGIRSQLAKHGIPGLLNQIGPVFHMMFIDAPEVSDFATFQQRDAAKYARFAEIMLEEGVVLRPSGLWYISAAHEEKDVDETLDAVDRALQRLKNERINLRNVLF